MKTSTIVSAIALGALVLSSSCSGKYSDYCDKYIDCEGGNDKDRDACVEYVKAAEDVAGDYDCGDSFDTAFDCTVNSAVCKNNKIDDGPCSEQSKAYSACVNAATGKHKDLPAPNIDGGKP